MIDYFLWGVSLLGLFIGIFWANVMSLPGSKKNNLYKVPPTVSFITPVLNEEKTINKTLKSIMELDYPQSKLEIIIVNDQSTDNTKAVVEKIIKNNPDWNILLLDRKKFPGEFTKAPAVNTGLKEATGEFVACLDADSTVKPDSLKKIFNLFDSDRVAAVISAIKVNNTKTIYGKIQRLEYLLATFVRELMSKVDTLHITPGALSVYRTETLKDLGGFDEKNITEDYEIAVRLKYHGYTIRIQTQSISYTNVPSTFWSLWQQRVRWFRGFITTSLKYKDMFANKKFGMMGVFQYPLNIISFAVVLLTFTLFSYEAINGIYNISSRLSVLGWSFFELLKIPSLKDMAFNLNIKVIFPIVVSMMIAFYIYYLAHKSQNEKLKYPIALLAYFTVYPPLRIAHWVTATYKEMFRRKNRW